MKTEIIEKLEALTQEKGYIYSFAWILIRDLFLDAEEAADIDWTSKLSYQELSFLAGLMIKRPIKIDDLDERISQNHLGRTDQYFKELHEDFNKPAMEHLLKKSEELKLAGRNSEEDYDSIFSGGDALAECIFYGDSGAYDFQFLDFAKRRYEKDREWLINNKGFKIETAVGICRKLKNLHINKYRELKPGNFSEFSKTALSMFCFSKDDLEEFDNKEVENVLKAFAVRPGAVNEQLMLPGEYNALNSHPIIVLEENLYFVPIVFNLAQSIYESPFYWMINDPSYKEISLKNRGEATVDIAYELMTKVFGEKNVHKQVNVQKNKATILTDIDLLVVAGSKAIVCQIKSKKLTAPARVGDEARLKKDFIEAIQESYDQALICRKAILEKENSLLTNAKHEIMLDDSINEAYILCITSDHYPAVTFQTKNLLQKNVNDPYPIGINIFDVDILTHYLNDPFQFLYYLRQRVALYTVFHGQNEIDFLAYHLNQKLYPLKDEKTGEPIDWVLIQGEGQLIDAHFPCVRADQPKTKAMEKLCTKWSNPQFHEIIDQLKSSKEPGFTEAIFFLYDLAGKGADDFMDSVKIVKDKCRREKKSLRNSMTFGDGKFGMSYVCDLKNDGKLARNVATYCQIKKYQTKSDGWLGLGGFADSASNISAITFNNTPWKYDAALEELSKTLYAKGHPISVKTGDRLGRNELCYCGSRVKFKKCHGK